MRDYVARVGLCPAHKLMVLGHGSVAGVDAETIFSPQCQGQDARDAVRHRLAIPADARVIGFVGRIVPDKGMHELATAWQILREEFSDLHLLLIGSFEQNSPLNPDDRRLFEMDARVHLAGRQHDIPSYLAAMDINVMPSYREGFGVTNIEAAAMALPVVATPDPRLRGFRAGWRDRHVGPAAQRDGLGPSDTPLPCKSRIALSPRAGGAMPHASRLPPRYAISCLVSRVRRFVAEKGTTVADLLAARNTNLGQLAKTSRRMNANRFQRLVKRMIDVFVAVVILLTSAPLIGSIALIIRWKMGSPILCPPATARPAWASIYSFQVSYHDRRLPSRRDTRRQHQANHAIRTIAASNQPRRVATALERSPGRTEPCRPATALNEVPSNSTRQNKPAATRSYPG